VNEITATSNDHPSITFIFSPSSADSKASILNPTEIVSRIKQIHRIPNGKEKKEDWNGFDEFSAMQSSRRYGL